MDLSTKQRKLFTLNTSSIQMMEKVNMDKVEITKFRLTQLVAMSLATGASMGFVVGFLIGLLDKFA